MQRFGVLSLIILCGGSQISAQAVDTAQRSLYLVAGTTTAHGLDAYPVTIYKIDQTTKKLDSIRQVVTGADGSLVILSDTINTIYVVSPHTMSNSVSLVHQARPSVIDNISLGPDVPNVVGVLATTAHVSDEGSFLLLWTLKGSSSSGRVDTLSIASNKLNQTPRIETVQSSIYKDLRVEGQPGGPQYSSQLIGEIVGSEIHLILGDERVSILNSLPGHSESWEGKRVSIVAVNDRYFVMSVTRTREQLSSGNLSPARYFVLDKTINKWTSINLSSDSPRTRLFGGWLATIDEFYSPNNDNNPGRENERAVIAKGFPDVKGDYASFAGLSYRIPGELSLYNLHDGRRLSIKTEQEDSEILNVIHDTIIYRLNGSIYAAAIENDKVAQPHLIVTDQDVPEIHWAFDAGN